MKTYDNDSPTYHLSSEVVDTMCVCGSAQEAGLGVH